jgi:hypothetical protein
MMRSTEHGGGRPAQPEWFIFFDPPRTRMQALIRAFTSRVIAARNAHPGAVAELLDRHIERGTMDLAEDYAVPLPMIGRRDARRFGGRPASLPALSDDADAQLHAVGRRGARVPDYAAATAEMDTYPAGRGRAARPRATIS